MCQLSSLLLLNHIVQLGCMWVNTALWLHVTEYCAVIGMHSIVRGDKLPYGHIPDPFLGPDSGTRSGQRNYPL